MEEYKYIKIELREDYFELLKYLVFTREEVPDEEQDMYKTLVSMIKDTQPLYPGE